MITAPYNNFNDMSMDEVIANNSNLKAKLLVNPHISTGTLGTNNIVPINNH